MPVADAPAAHTPAQHAPAHHRRGRFDRVEWAVYRAINDVRARRGLPKLHLSPKMSAMAAWHSRDLLAHGILTHSSSDGTPFYSRIRRVANARVVGENLIEFRGNRTGRRIVGAWMHSPSHRAEVLAPGYRRIGVGRSRGRGLSVVTADFASEH